MVMMVVAAGAATLVFAAAASAGSLRVGIADDWPQYHPCGDVWWQAAADIGFRELRLTVQWDGTPVIPNQAGIQAAADCAVLGGMRPVLAVYPARPALIGDDPAEQAAFARFVGLVGQAFPQIRDFVVGNEPNVNRFWQPQFLDGKDAAARDYEHTLARSYDALKTVRPDASVWGPAISSRGNDSPYARSNPSHSPVVFIEELGAAYRASGRTRPIFDVFDLHPYPPVQDTDSYAAPFRWPQAGAANLSRIKQALWDAFAGTAQPVPAEQPAPPAAAGQTPAPTLPISLDEAGSQTTVTADPGAYTDGPESIRPISPALQAVYYTQLIQIAGCDPDVQSLLFFQLIDETDLRQGFQSGELYANLVHKQSYAAIKQLLASPDGVCPAMLTTWWRPTAQVIGARASFGAEVAVTASEAATYRAGIFAVRQAGSPTLAGVARGLTSAQTVSTLTASVGGEIHAYSTSSTDFGSFSPGPGTYVYGVTISAVANPFRDTTFVSRPFTIRATRFTMPHGLRAD
jgi:hypothetical protein